MQRNTLLKLGAFIVVSAGIGAAIPLFYHAVIGQTNFALKTIQITGQLDRVTKEEALAYAKPFMGESLYGLDLVQLRRLLLEHPWIGDISFRRLPPHELEIKITERTPVALLALDRIYVLDADAKPIEPASLTNFLKLPVIRGMSRSDYVNDPDQSLRKLRESIEVLRAYQKISPLDQNMTELRLAGLDGITAVFDNNLEVFLGNSQFEKKWQLLAQMVKQLPEQGHNLAFAYLGDKNLAKVPVRFRQEK